MKFLLTVCLALLPYVGAVVVLTEALWRIHYFSAKATKQPLPNAKTRFLMGLMWCSLAPFALYSIGIEWPAAIALCILSLSWLAYLGSLAYREISSDPKKLLTGFSKNDRP